MSIVEMMDKIASGESSTILPIILKDFEQGGVKQYVNTRVQRVQEHGVIARTPPPGKRSRSPVTMWSWRWAPERSPSMSPA